MPINAYNGMSAEIAQLYNERLVHNYKRDGHVVLNGRKVHILKKRLFTGKTSTPRSRS